MNKTANYLLVKFYLIVIISISMPFLVVAQNQDTKSMTSKIQTQTDPYFIYDYEGTKFVPPADKTLLIMGQTVERIEEYLDKLSEKPIPAGWSAYWGIPEFVGIKKAHRNDTGSTQNHQMLVDKFPNTVIHSAMWMVGTWNIAERTANGDYDRVLKKYCAWAKSIDRPIYLRIGYEFDGPHNELEPAEYVKAYKHIVDYMRKKGVNNVAFVWHSYAAPPYKNYSLSDWYPGDTYVDWVAVSVFEHAYDDMDFGKYTDDVLEFAKRHKKPVMIAESNPVRGIENDNDDVWNQWFVNFFSFAYQKNIKAICFINEDWTSLRIPGISEWKDSRIYNNDDVSEAWFNETNKDRYLKQSPILFNLLGYQSDK